MTKDEIKDKIIEIYEKLLKIDDDIITVNSSLSYVDSFSTNAIKLENERDFLYEKFKDLKSELASLKSQLSEAGGENKRHKRKDCTTCSWGYITSFDEEPCSSCDRDVYSNWQPR